jgi:hypothetical protein
MMQMQMKMKRQAAVSMQQQPSQSLLSVKHRRLRQMPDLARRPGIRISSGIRSHATRGMKTEFP